MKSKVRQKTLYIEQLRILAIFTVIGIHCYGNYFVNSGLYNSRIWWATNILNGFCRWGVPIFFMISGILLLDGKKDEGIKSFIFRRLTKVLIPFILWSIIYYINFCFNNHLNPSLGNFIQKFLTQNIAYHLWFMYTLLNIYIVVPILRKITFHSSKKELLYLCIVMIFATTLRPFLNKFFGIYITAIFPLFDGYLTWFIYGYFINLIHFTKKHRLVVYILGFIGVIMSIGGTYFFSNKEQIDTFFNLGFQINSYFVATAIFVFFKYEMIQINKHLIVEKICLGLGKYVFGVYLVHVLVLEKLKLYLPFSRPYQDIIYNWLLTFILSFLVIFCVSKLKTSIIALFHNMVQNRKSTDIDCP